MVSGACFVFPGTLINHTRNIDTQADEFKKCFARTGTSYCHGITDVAMNCFLNLVYPNRNELASYKL